MSNGKDKFVKSTCEKKPRPGTETRDAVEAAIDLSKERRDATWEQQVKANKRITRWTQNAPESSHRSC